MNASKVLVLLAVLAFILAAFGLPTLGGLVSLVPLGLALYAGAQLVG